MKNRWLIAASAVGIHISIGSVYAWSVISKPMISVFGWSLKDVSLTFSIAIAFLGLSAAFFGGWVERKGPRKAGMLAAVLFGGGLLIAGIACQIRSLPLLYLGYGAIGGTGIGLGYITPVATLLRWFPDKRGLATGIAIMGFGFAALVSGPLIQRIIETAGIPAVFYSLAGIYFVLIFTSAQYLAPPPEGWRPTGSPLPGTRQPITEPLQLTAAEAIGTIRFYLLWLMFFLNITCGIAVISVASPMSQELAGLTPQAAAFMVGILGVFNGLGRIGWSTLSDRIGRPALWILFFVLQCAAFLLLPHAANTLLFQCLVFLIVSCYGGGFASMPAFLSDLFGTRQVSAILGYILTAWAAAGIVGPIFVAWIRQTTGSYEKTFLIFSGLFAAALILSLLLALDRQKHLPVFPCQQI